PAGGPRRRTLALPRDGRRVRGDRWSAGADRAGSHDEGDQMSNPMIPAAKPVIGDEERAAVDRVLRSGMIAQGPEVAAFETEFAGQLGGGGACVAVSSGTSGLHLGLLAAGIGPGDEVIVPSFTFAATANSVALTGATPVFADIDPVTFNLSPAAAEAAI